MKEGFNRNTLQEIPEKILENRDKTLALGDEELAKLLKFFSLRKNGR